eukprot:4055301-Karenia_brevis.AAC.1
MVKPAHRKDGYDRDKKKARRGRKQLEHQDDESMDTEDEGARSASHAPSRHAERSASRMASSRCPSTAASSSRHQQPDVEDQSEQQSPAFMEALQTFRNQVAHDMVNSLQAS